MAPSAYFGANRKWCKNDRYRLIRPTVWNYWQNRKQNIDSQKIKRNLHLQRTGTRKALFEKLAYFYLDLL